jgi:hypothetical protein
MDLETEIFGVINRQNLLETLTKLKKRQRVKIYTNLDLSISTGNFISESLLRESQTKVIYFFLAKKTREIDFINAVYEKFHYCRSYEPDKNYYHKNYAKIIRMHCSFQRLADDLLIFDNYGTISQNLRQAVHKLVKEIENPVAFIFRNYLHK